MCSALLLRLLPGLDLPPCVPTRSTKLPNGVCVASEDAPVAPISPLLLPSDESIADGGHRVRAHVHPDLTGSRTWISIFGSSVLMKPACEDAGQENRRNVDLKTEEKQASLVQERFEVDIKELHEKIDTSTYSKNENDFTCARIGWMNVGVETDPQDRTQLQISPSGAELFYISLPPFSSCHYSWYCF
ncbi:hypothetical protein TRIUR3_29840 [Triticum urartu]|uniref:Uncharacterized protein n=1 Tax=Triticum urartu TaxID=4572 RepID=M7Z1L3_TRIUA|nr:hypothetical protein TRIUR3_29840 [Triticum urartu]